MLAVPVWWRLVSTVAAVMEEVSSNTRVVSTSILSFSAMMLNRQFEAPTFAQINADLRAYHALLNRAANDFLSTSAREPYAQLTPVDQEIMQTFHILSSLEMELHRRIQFFDTEPEAETVLVRPLTAIMHLPPISRSRLVEGTPRRKSSYTPREKTRGPYRSYTAQEKDHVVQLNQSGMSFAAISKSLEIPQKNVVRWCKEGFNGRDANRRIADGQMELELAVWVARAKSHGLVKQTDIQQKARELSTNPQFKASRGWLKNFLRRFNTDVKQEEHPEQTVAPHSEDTPDPVLK